MFIRERICVESTAATTAGGRINFAQSDAASQIMVICEKHRRVYWYLASSVNDFLYSDFHPHEETQLDSLSHTAACDSQTFVAYSPRRTEVKVLTGEWTGSRLNIM